MMFIEQSFHKWEATLLQKPVMSMVRSKCFSFCANSTAVGKSEKIKKDADIEHERHFTEKRRSV